HCALQAQSFVYAGTNESFNLLLPESRQHAAAESSHEALGAGKPNPISFVGAAIEYFDSFLGHHSGEFGLAVALEVVIPEHRDDMHPKPDENVQQGFHFLGLAEIGEIAGKNNTSASSRTRFS